MVDKLTFEFAILIIKSTELLFHQKHLVIAGQLLKSGTSIGANVREAKQAESRADFIHKLKIASKEASETEYWLLICKEMNYFDTTICLQNLLVIQKILSSSISTAKQNQKSQ